jgi:glycerol-3-phosphate dehydrogenase
VLEGRERRRTARVVINAAGAWADRVRLILSRALRPGSPDPRPMLRPTRGVHLVFPPLTAGHALLLTTRSDGRVLFVLPFRDAALVGTTEAETSSPPEETALEPDPEEIRYLRSELARVLPRPAALPVLAVTSGLRPLLASGGEVTRASREHRVLDEHGVLTVVGGKYTTFRVMARDAVAAAMVRLGRDARRLKDAADPLPRSLPSETPLETAVEFAVREEFSRRLEDVLRRRTALWLAPDRGRVAAPAVAAIMARLLDWNAVRSREELQSYDEALEREQRVLQSAREVA